MSEVCANNVLTKLNDVETLQHTLSWQHFRSGIEIYPLSSENKQVKSALLRYAPGASVPMHKHTGFEYIHILSGSQTDESGTYEQGTLLISKPESSHSVTSKSGCIVLAIWCNPVEFT